MPGARSGWSERATASFAFWNNDVTVNIRAVLEAIHVALYGSLDSDAVELKHERKRHPTPARSARRPSPSRGG